MATRTIVTRNWEHVAPIAMKDVSTFGVDLQRRDATPNLWAEDSLDGAETSLSGYVRARAAGDRSVVALPIFLMRGFRHRCIITRRDSPLERGADLRGKRIGLTGWADSGNVWTRAVLRSEGVAVTDATWRVGALTSSHDRFDRIGCDVPDAVDLAATENDEPLTDMLEDGRLDAVMTPFMPHGFYHEDSPFRTLYRDSRRAEAQYFSATGFVPGIHVLAVKAEVLERDPSLAQRLVDLFEQSKILSTARRTKLQDVTPWHNIALELSESVIGSNWSPNGISSNRSMIEAFQGELVAQQLLDDVVREHDLFPYAVDPTLES